MRMYASRRPDAPVMEAAILAGPAMGAVADWSLMRESRAGVTEDVSSSRKRKQEGEEGAFVSPFHKMRMMHQSQQSRLEAASSLVSTLTGQADALTWPSASGAEPSPSQREPQGSQDVSGATSETAAGFGQARGGAQGVEGLHGASPQSAKSGGNSTGAAPQAEAYSQFRPFASGAEAGADAAPSGSGSTGKTGWGFQHLQQKANPWLAAAKPIKRYESVFGAGSESAGTGKGASGITSSGSGLATQGDARHAAVQLEVDQRLSAKWAPRKPPHSGLGGQPSVLGGGRSASFSGVTEVRDFRERSDGASSSEDEEEEKEEDGIVRKFLPKRAQAQAERLDGHGGGSGQEQSRADASAISESPLLLRGTVTEEGPDSDAGAHLGDKRVRGGGVDGGQRGMKCMRLEGPGSADLKEGAPFQYWAQVETRGTPPNSAPNSTSELRAAGAEAPEASQGASPAVRGDRHIGATAGGDSGAGGGGRASKRSPDALAPTERQRRPGERPPAQDPLNSTANAPNEGVGFVNSRGGQGPLRRGGSPTGVWQLRDEEDGGGGRGGGKINSSACDTGADSGADVESSARLSGYDPETSASDFQDEDGFVLSSGRTRHGRGTGRSSRAPTIDDEFEAYFSAMLL